MKLLLHICCAPCSIMSVKKLRENGIDVTGFWYNPNIHPYMEYRARRDALRNYSKTILGKDICAPIIKIYNDVEEINSEELPDKFVLKCNHACGYNILYTDKYNFDKKKPLYNSNIGRKTILEFTI